MSNPHSACPEGHCFCYVCYARVIRTNAKCPSCRFVIPRVPKLLRNRPLGNMIGELGVRCPYAWSPDMRWDVSGQKRPREGMHVKTCSWAGTVATLSLHLANDCEFEPMACPNAMIGCNDTM
ncbi:hypothetical protein T484DRAFT_1864571, partial [Baffinella frigidus]